MVLKPNPKELEETLTATLEDLGETVKKLDKNTKKKLSSRLDRLITECERTLEQWKPESK